jgi:ribosomal protein L12E/L44/L45/RPP1/RPP2
MFGQQCLILIITQSGAEGISLKNVRQVHVMEPYWNNVRVNQVIGRARRVESHVHLPKDQQNVKIFKYVIQFTAAQKDASWAKKNIKGLIGYNYDELIEFKKTLDKKLERGANADVKKAIEEGKVEGDGEEEEEKKKQYTESDKHDFIAAVSRAIETDERRSSDEELNRMSSEKDATLSEYIKMIKESSVDCHFNREANIRADPDYAKSTCYVNMTNIQRNPYMYDYHMDGVLVTKAKETEVAEGDSGAEKPAVQMVYKVFNYKDPSDPKKVMRLRVLVPELTDVKDIPDGTDVLDEQNVVVGNFVRVNGKTHVRLFKK